MKKFCCVNLALIALGSGFLVNAAQKQPVYIYLHQRVGDHVNVEMSEDRLRRIIPMLEKYRKQHPRANVSATILLSGAMSQALVDRNSGTAIKDFVQDAAKRRVIDIGYDGTDEPTYQGRPHFDLSRAKTAEDRWISRSTAAERFLTEARDLTGMPVAGKSGGLKLLQEIFGEASCITGVTEEVGGDSELVRQMSRYNTKAIMFGVPDAKDAKHIHGFRGSAMEFGRQMSPTPDSSPELFWQDNVLRSSESSDGGVRLVMASEGPEALKTLLSKLDRSKVRVVHVEVGDLKNHLTQDFVEGPMFPPLRYAYSQTANPKLPADAMQTADAVNAAYAKEEAVIRWLVEDYLAANPESRFVSSTDLKQMTLPSLNFSVSVEKLRSALKDSVAMWNETTLPPPYLFVDGRYLSLADMFQVMTDSLAELHRTGKYPQSVKVTRMFGPVPILDDNGSNTGDVKNSSIAKKCAEIAPGLHDESPKPVPNNRVPSSLTVDGSSFNAAQFLHLMAQAIVGPPDGIAKVRMKQMLSVSGEVAPKTRGTYDQSAAWTYKPAPVPSSPALQTMR
jgi:hypothetical protein